MGDLKTHAGIAEEIQHLIESSRSGENPQFFELGNFLTDVSQVRDPTSAMGLKSLIWRMETNIVTQALANPIYDLGDYLDELLGKPGPQGGLLAAWLRDLVFVVGIEKFRRASPHIEPRRFEHVWLRYFTRYYPHEHMDFPPWPPHDIVGDRTLSEWNQHRCDQEPTRGSGRKLCQYQEDQIVYVSDLLTLVERDWARAPLDPATVEEREEILTRFGHASHALEDFFFHSNFVERAWKESGRALPLPEPNEGTGEDPDHRAMTPTRARRIYYRRLRSPKGNGDELDREESLPMSAVFTSYFAGNDVYHVLIDTLRGLDSKERTPDPLSPLLAVIRGERREKRGSQTKEQRKKEREQSIERHKLLLASGIYVATARGARDAGALHAKSFDAIERMCRIDKEMFDRYKDINLGIVGMLRTFSDLAEDAEQASELAAANLDARGIINDDRSYNGASAENIGSHTLMAKDSERKHPLREQAVTLGSCAAMYVASRMVESRDRSSLPVARSVPESPAPSDGGSSNTTDFRYIDWLHLLQHFICHPNEAEIVDGGVEWWKKQFENLDHTETGHVLRFLRDRKEVERRCKEEMKQELERRYDKLAGDLEKEWRTLQNRATGTLVGAIIGAVAGAVAGAIIGGMVGGVWGAILGGIIGAVGGAFIGGVLGGLIGSLF